MAKGGIGIRAQGMRRYYALLLCDDNDHVLAETDFNWQINQSYALRLQAEGLELRAWIDGELLFTVQDGERPLTGGAAAFVVEEGHMMSYSMVVRPLP
jgi:hypothetical protein